MTDNTNTTPAPFDLWAELDRIAAAEGGGGGIVALCDIAVGYKVYAPGVAQAEAFFPAIPGNETSLKTAKVSADALAQVHQVKVSRFGMQITAHRDGALSQGKPVTWTLPARYFNADVWTEAYKGVMGPSVKAAGIAALPWTGWARIGFKPDPFQVQNVANYCRANGKVESQLTDEEKPIAGMKDTDQAGNPRYSQVAYIVEVFPDEATAKASAASDVPVVSASPNGTEPAWKPESAGWKTEDLQAIGPQLVTELQTKPLTQVAAEYSLTIGDALVALGEHKTKLPPVAVAGKYKVDVAEVSKVRDLASVIPF